MENKEIGLLYNVVLVVKSGESATLNLLKVALPDYLIIKSNTMGCRILKIGAYNDHLHFIISIPPKFSIIEIINTIKESSINYLTKNIKNTVFEWSEGFYISTICYADLESTYKLANGKVEFHNNTTLEEEIANFVKV